MYIDWWQIQKLAKFLKSPINVQCLLVYTGKHCTLIGYIRFGYLLFVHWLVTFCEMSPINVQCLPILRMWYFEYQNSCYSGFRAFQVSGSARPNPIISSHILNFWRLLDYSMTSDTDGSNLVKCSILNDDDSRFGIFRFNST